MVGSVSLSDEPVGTEDFDSTCANLNDSHMPGDVRSNGGNVLS